MASGSLRATQNRRWWLRVAAMAGRLVAIGLAVGWLAYEWQRWPNGSALLGPLGLVRYNGPTAGNLACCATGLLLLLAYPAWPGRLTAAVSVLGLLLWVSLGALAKGIGC